MDRLVKRIERSIDGSTVIVDGTISEGCIFENTMVGFGTLIIDNDFINQMIEIAKNIKVEGNFINMLSIVNNKIFDYYYSDELNKLSRQDIYEQNLVIDENGIIVGTRISSLKEKNIALCSEKSIAAYIILKFLYDNNKITRKPSLVLSSLGVLENQESMEPHAFLTLDKETDNYPFKHLLFDVQNPSELVDEEGNKSYFAGLYALLDDEKSDIVNGYKCSPTSIYELLGNYHDIGAKRIYGSKDKILNSSVSFAK